MGDWVFFHYELSSLIQVSKIFRAPTLFHTKYTPPTPSTNVQIIPKPQKGHGPKKPTLRISESQSAPSKKHPTNQMRDNPSPGAALVPKQGSLPAFLETMANPPANPTLLPTLVSFPCHTMEFRMCRWEVPQIKASEFRRRIVIIDDNNRKLCMHRLRSQNDAQ